MTGARLARFADTSTIARIEVETWRETYAGTLADNFLVGMSVRRRGGLWAELLRRPGHGLWVWEEEADGVVGFGHCGRTRGKSAAFDGEIYMLYVLPDSQARGIGRQLLLAMFESLWGTGSRSALVWVVRANPARFFYERMDAKLVGQHQMRVGGVSVDVLGYGWSDLGATLYQHQQITARKLPDAGNSPY